MITLTVGAAASALLGLIILELPAVASWASLRLLRRAVARLPKRTREIKLEEWTAELDTLDGSRVFKLVLAASFCRAAKAMTTHEAMQPGLMRDALAGTGYEVILSGRRLWLRSASPPQTVEFEGGLRVPIVEPLWDLDDMDSLPIEAREAIRNMAVDNTHLAVADDLDRRRVR
jgi:hypothetical protein